MKNNLRYRIFKSYKSFIQKLKNTPGIGPFIIWAISNLKNLGVYIYVFFITRFSFINPLGSRYRAKPIKEDIIWISPMDVVYVSHLKTDDNGYHQVKSGNWDRLDTKFESSQTSIALREIQNEFTNKNEKQKISGSIPTEILEKISAVSTDNRDLLNQWQKWIELDDADKKKQFIEIIKPGDIHIDIGRFGDLLASSGQDLLVLAQLLGIESIPVKVSTRHLKWMRFRKRFELLSTDVGDKSYQPPLHPDLAFIPASQSSVERLGIIKKHLSIHNGRLLDLGANIGYFTINFEKDGFNCTAIENYPLYVFCIKGQKRALNKNFRIITDSILTSKEITNESYDVVLALNILFHFLYRKRDFERLCVFLDNLKCKEFYFEPHLYTDPQLINSYKNFHEEEFVEFVKTRLHLKKAELIGTASDKRHIYKIT